MVTNENYFFLLKLVPSMIIIMLLSALINILHIVYNQQLKYLRSTYEYLYILKTLQIYDISIFF